MSSRSGSESGSDRSSRSGSPASIHGSAPTPGYSLEQKSQPNSPNDFSKSQRSRSPSVESNKSATSRKSRSRSVQSNRSDGSNRSGNASQTSRPGSAQSGHRSRSGSNASNKSGRSRSGSASSEASQRSRSGSKASQRSRSGSKASQRSRSGSKTSNRSRSGSAGSKHSRSSGSNRSRSGSRSAASSRSASAESKKSRRSKSRSRSRSRSNTPNLEIDEGPADKRKLSDDDEDLTQIMKKKRVIDSDSEDEHAGKEVSAAAIFGDDADDISSEEEKEKRASDKEQDEEEEQEKQRSDDEQNQPHKSDTEAPREDDEDRENEPEPIPETRIDVEIPKISCDLGRDIHFVKLPNFLSVETRPFDPETYEDEIDEEETLDEEGRARLKLKVENTIRWRDTMDKDGNFKKESNAKMVRWSDGSYSLHLGSEIFDVYKQPLQGDHNHLFIRQGTGLQGQAVFRTKLSFRPHSTESFTHRKMTLSLADRSQKTSGIKILSQVGVDPEQDRYLRLKKEEDKLRQASRTFKPRTKRDSARSHNSSRGGEEDGSDDEGAISLNAIKNKYKQAAQNKASAAIYSSDEEGSDIEMKSKKQGKVVNFEESEESE